MLRRYPQLRSAFARLLVAGVLGAPLVGAAQTVIWNDSIVSALLWATPLNWQGSLVPGAGADVEFTSLSHTLGLGFGSTISLGVTSYTYNSLDFTSGVGAQTFALSGTGTLTLTSSFTNNNSGSSATLASNVALGPTFSFIGPSSGAATSLTLSGGLTSSGTVALTGNINLILSGTGTPTGTVTVGSGATLQFVESTGQTIQATIANSGLVYFGNNVNDGYTFSGTISGNGGVVIAGGTTFSNAGSTYSGATNIGSGSTLSDSSVANAFSPNSTIHLAGASGTGNTSNLTVNKNEVIGGLVSTTIYDVISVNNPATLKVTGGGSVAGQIGGAGTFEYSDLGGTLVDTGTIALNAATSVLDIDKGTFQIGDGTNWGSTPAPASTVLNGLLNFDLSSSGSITYGGSVTTISGAGGINIAQGFVTLAGTTSYSGTTELQNGTSLSDSAADNFSPASIFKVDGSAVLNVNNAEVIGGLTVATGSGSVNIQSEGELTVQGSGTNLVAGTIAGPGSLTFSGSGSFIDTGTLNLASQLTINSGVLQMGNGTSAGSFGASTPGVTDDAELAFNNGSASTTTIPFVISGGGSVNVMSGSVVLNAEAQYTGSTTIGSYATLTANDGFDSTACITVNPNGTMVFGGSDCVTVSNMISNGGFVQFGTGNSGAMFTYEGSMSGSGQVQIYNNTTFASACGDNTYSGDTTISGCYTLSDSNSNAFSANSAIKVQNGTLNVNYKETIAGLDIDNGSANLNDTLKVTGSSVMNGSSGSIGGEGTLKFDGGSSTFVVSEGTLAPNEVQVVSGTFQLGDGEVFGASINTDFNLCSGGTLQIALGSSDTTLCYNGSISGSGALVVNSGTLKLGGESNSYSGTTTIDGNGVLADTSSNSFSSESIVKLSSGGQLNVNYGEQIAGLSGCGGVAIAGGATLDIDTGESSCGLSLMAVITGCGALKIDGSQTEILSGNNTYSGGTSIDGNVELTNCSGSGLGSGFVELCDNGTLTLGNGNDMGSFAGDIKVDGTLTFDRADPVCSPFVFSNAITGSGSLVFEGTGAVAVTGNNSGFGGSSSITAGIVLLENTCGSALGSGTVCVTGGTLEGSGIQQSAVTVKSGGVITAQDNLAPTTLTVGELDMNNNGSLSVAMSSAGGTAGSGWGLIAVSNAANVNANSSNPFTIDLFTVSGGASGLLSDFNSSQSYQWTIVTAGGGLNGFNTGTLVLNTSGFENAFGTGIFSLAADNNDLYIDFTPVPEPSTWALMIAGAGIVGWAGYRAQARRRRA